MYNEVQNPIPNIPMVELKAYKICDIDIRAIIGQKQRFWMCLRGYFDVQYGFTDSLRKRKPGLLLCKGRAAGNLFLSL